MIPVNLEVILTFLDEFPFFLEWVLQATFCHANGVEKMTHDFEHLKELNLEHLIKYSARQK